MTSVSDLFSRKRSKQSNDTPVLPTKPKSPLRLSSWMKKKKKTKSDTDGTPPPIDAPTSADLDTDDVGPTPGSHAQDRRSSVTPVRESPPAPVVSGHTTQSATATPQLEGHGLILSTPDTSGQLPVGLTTPSSSPIPAPSPRPVPTAQPSPSSHPRANVLAGSTGATLSNSTVNAVGRDQNNVSHTNVNNDNSRTYVNNRDPKLQQNTVVYNGDIRSNGPLNFGTISGNAVMSSGTINNNNVYYR
ncbi:hypothetical protein FA15DRAFT_675534 [Coprinopsis marcescibilis]|uniref:Uncharacterized protein n=1 Tax=Coprinopsis marcescibilis TaxID=230819 RepID=A0A5C3KE18_COPMA|nr:hypothetical protein FA15DRAFT_675534 [Coprinopsis marcescibilis]